MVISGKTSWSFLGFQDQSPVVQLGVAPFPFDLPSKIKKGNEKTKEGAIEM